MKLTPPSVLKPREMKGKCTCGQPLAPDHKCGAYVQPPHTDSGESDGLLAITGKGTCMLSRGEYIKGELYISLRNHGQLVKQDVEIVLAKQKKQIIKKLKKELIGWEVGDVLYIIDIIEKS